MHAGRLRTRLTIERIQSAGTDAAGQPQRTWSTVATVWGSVEQLSGRELMDGQQLQAQTTHRLTLRHDPARTLTTADRITAGGITYQLLSVENPDLRARQTICLAVVQSA